MRIARGGKAVYGAPLGILMLDARFPRIPGDMGHAGTWPFPVLYRIVPGATPARVVLDGAAGLLPRFLDAAAELVAMGAEAITTNCGFLSLFQQELAAHVGVPAMTSSLMQAPWVQATLPGGRRVGLVTVCAGSLNPHAPAGRQHCARYPHCRIPLENSELAVCPRRHWSCEPHFIGIWDGSPHLADARLDGSGECASGIRCYRPLY